MIEYFQNICHSLKNVDPTLQFDTYTPADKNVEISELLTDSRCVGQIENTLFFALRTSRDDGHKYICDLYAKGVRAFVVERKFDIIPYPEASFVIADNVADVLMACGCYASKNLNGTKIGITGSRGKTLVKEWLAQILSKNATVARSPRSFNSSIGVPISLWQADSAADYVLIEAGISQVGEMAPLEHMISPEIVIITDISDAHSDGFDSLEQKIAEKLALARNAKVLIYSSAVPGLKDGIYQALRDKRLPKNITLIDSSECAGYTNPRLSQPWESANVATCVALLRHLGESEGFISSAIAELRSINTRLNVVDGVNNCQIVVDDYPFDVDSIGPALDFVNSRRVGSQKVTLICSGADVTTEKQDKPDESSQCNKTLMQILHCKGVSRIITLSKNSKLTPSDFNNEIILFEDGLKPEISALAHTLEARTHETVLEVNLNALVSNLNFYRSHLKPTTGVVAMVKASGYGAGSYELAKTLQARGAAYLAVAVLDEGIDLRRAGITMPIMVLNPKVLNYPQLFAHRLEPEIYDFDILEEIIEAASRCGIKRYPVHIKLDTGMHRLGFLEADINRLIEQLKQQDSVEVLSVFSHLATADCPDMNDYTEMQLDTFRRCSQKIVDAFPGHKVMQHILNTAGILRYPQYQYDMVRLGIGLYGIPVLNDGSEEGLRPVSTLRSPIISIKTWEAGTTIGYGRRGLLTRRSVIATVPIGYADGIDRHMGRGAVSFLVNGVKCPTVGNICMDILMLDVTDANATVGDSVIIFGEDNPATMLAEALDTIPYEILTSVSPRVRRLYYSE